MSILNLKKKILSIASAIAISLTAQSAYAAEICDCGVLIGADYLYWSPCVSNLHFAAEAQNAFSESENEVSYHFIHTDWDPGYRIYLGKEDLFGCFDLMGTYTHFDSRHTESLLDGSETTPLLVLTWPTPVFPGYNHYATADWKIKLDRGELVAGYSIEFGKGCCLVLKPFAGVDYASIKQDREDLLMDVRPNPDVDPPVAATQINTISRSIDYQGVGPIAGIGYAFAVCGELSTFGKASLSLLVGDAAIKEKQSYVNTGSASENYLNVQSYKDRCVCVPGVHLQTGFCYAANVCNKWVNVRVGYEYLQWMNAPSHLLYDMDYSGSFTGLNNNSITFQGFFGGISLLF